jgi:hypothetical protein
MAIFSLFLILAHCILSISAQNLVDEAAPAPFHLNVTTGGFFDDLPQCSVSTVHEISPWFSFIVRDLVNCATIYEKISGELYFQPLLTLDKC